MTAKNYLLAALSKETYAKLAPHLTLVSLEQGRLLWAPGELLSEVYFPIGCALSVTLTLQDGSSIETSLIGNRGMMSVNAVISSSAMTHTNHVVQIAGNALRIDARILREEFYCNLELREVLSSYAQVFIAQLSQNIACNRFHMVEQRLARWMLEVKDCVESDKLKVTQEFIAEMLGTRRAGVTQAAQKLQERDLIQYSRGYIQILDQRGLEAKSCECYKMLKGEHDRLLGRKQEELF
ncbi:Crp/Fnr family transcriptional regulator [Phormidium tenue FACHB-886]|nr:Crp/Fnr family transcriptional regulator [Phormidium tenue FACHB-886]